MNYALHAIMPIKIIGNLLVPRDHSFYWRELVGSPSIMMHTKIICCNLINIKIYGMMSVSFLCRYPINMITYSSYSACCYFVSNFLKKVFPCHIKGIAHISLSVSCCLLMRRFWLFCNESTA